MDVKTLFGILLILFALFLGLSAFGVITLFELNTLTLSFTSALLAVILGIALVRSKKPASATDK